MTEALTTVLMNPNIAIENLVESPRNVRRTFAQAEHEELLDSIKRHGVLAPLIVRKMAKKADKFEVLCGSRRLRAAKQAGLVELPCRVLEADDDVALEIMVVDNLQRANVHPLEEAEIFQELLKRSNGDYVGVSVKTGKNRGYIAQRLKLVDLIEKARKIYLAGKMTIEHALQLARLPEEQQKLALSNWDHDPNGPSVHELRSWIEENVMLDLARAPWDKAITDLVPGVVSCVACPKRTGQAKDLFNDVKSGDRCTDPVCWKKKMQAHIEGTQRQLEAKGSKVVGVWSAWRHEAPKNTLTRDDYREVKKTDKHCQAEKKGIFLDGEKAGRPIDICTDKKCPVHTIRPDSKFEKSLQASRKKEGEKRKKNEEEGAVRRRLLGEIFRKAPALNDDDLRYIARQAFERLWHESKAKLLRALGWSPEKRERGQEAFEFVEAKINALSGNQLPPFILAIALSGELDANHEKAENLRKYAKRLGIDEKKLKEKEEKPKEEAKPEAKKAKAEPKKKAAVNA